MLLGNLAHLPDLPPDAAQYSAKLKAADLPALPEVPRGTNEPPMPGLPMGPKFGPGTKVRDKLSGQTGSVVEAPGGPGIDYGEVVFVKMDGDGATHPLLSDFLEAVPTAAPVSPLSPGLPSAPSAMAPSPAAAPGPEAGAPAEGAPAPGSPIPEKKPKSTNAAFRRMLNSRLSKPVERQGTFHAAGPIKVTAAATDHDDPVVTRPGDSRGLRYSAVLAKLKASPGPSHNDALKIIGYVPANWDLLVARLLGDGVMLRSKKASFDVAALVKAKFTTDEIRYILGCKGVPMYALDRAFASLKANNPSKPMPTEEPGADMVWAWDEQKQDWYKTAKAG